MSEGAFHLVKIPLRADRVVEVARRRQIPIRDLDDGYLAHCVLRELWQADAPSPFVLRGRGRFLDVWGYAKADASALVEHARAFGDPGLLAVLGGIDSIASRPMPTFGVGQRVGFHLRACPVVRLAKPRGGYRAGAEIDAFLARCHQVGPDVSVRRDDVYREWLHARMEGAAAVERVAVAGFARERLVRRTHGAERVARRLERPDVRFEGELVVSSPDRFLVLVRQGVGRHRSFGFGALIMVSPGTPYPRT